MFIIIINIIYRQCCQKYFYCICFKQKLLYDYPKQTNVLLDTSYLCYLNTHLPKHFTFYNIVYNALHMNNTLIQKNLKNLISNYKGKFWSQFSLIVFLNLKEIGIIKFPHTKIK